MSYKLNYETPRPVVESITLTVTPEELQALRCHAGRTKRSIWTENGKRITDLLHAKITEAWEELRVAEGKPSDNFGDSASVILVNGSITD